MIMNHDEDDGGIICAICQDLISKWPSRTDCGHHFCLQCICHQLSIMENICSVCRSTVKKVWQQTDLNETQEKNVSIRYSNVIYELNISLWSVSDPIKILEDLFSLKQARIVFQGKKLHNNRDIWPGMKIMLFGTKRNVKPLQSQRFQSIQMLISSFFEFCHQIWLFIYMFFHSLFWGQKYSKIPTESYQMDNSPRESFIAPGHIPPP